MNNLQFVLFIGIGANVVMDFWGIVRKTLLGIPPPNYRLVGRWIAHMGHGQFRHDAIANASPMRGEQIIGWAFHYMTGIAFAAILIGFWGDTWIHNPTLGPALTIGIGTVTAPFLLMQPAMGAGFAASRTQYPGSNRLQSLLTHTVFGLGLYTSGWAVKLLYSI